MREVSEKGDYWAFVHFRNTLWLSTTESQSTLSGVGARGRAADAMEAAWEEQGWAVVRPALRVLQLDASRLDRLLVDMLQRQLVQSVSPLEWLLEARKHDVSFVLSTLLYVLTVARTGATYGQRLLNLRYHSGQMNIARTTILIHYGCTVLLPWCWRRGTEVLADAPEAVSPSVFFFVPLVPH